MPKVVYIYVLKDPRDKRIRYVGKTNNIDRRYEQHLYNRNEGNPHKDRWITNLQAKGLKPLIEIIEECNGEDWRDREIYWIDKCRCDGEDLINIKHGGDGYTSETWREYCVVSAAKRLHIEIKRCFVCGGKTISHVNICSRCMRKIDPDYIKTDWYKFLDKERETYEREKKRNKDKFVRLDDRIW
jgi:hypothetical protein